MDIIVKSHAGTQDLALVVKRYVIADRVCAITLKDARFQVTKIIVVITSGIFYYLPKYDISLMFDSIFGGFFLTRFQTKHFTAYLR